jgi:hypothetical protein
MLTSFNQLPPKARLWVYQANRFLTSSEKEIVQVELAAFCEQWMAHGHPLNTSFKIEHQLFVVLAVDETMSGASGCSVDGSVRMLKELQSKIGVDFFDRSSIAFWVDGTVKLHKLTELKSLVADGILTGNTLSFNNAITSKQDFDNAWLVAINKSWLQKYLPKKELA